jgi:hypothetical protein
MVGTREASRTKILRASAKYERQRRTLPPRLLSKPNAWLFFVKAILLLDVNANVCLWHKADMPTAPANVRY